MQASYKKKVLLLILLFAAARCVVASLTELGNDESYYWLFSQQLQWNYFDHPPLVAVLVKVFSLDLLLQDYTLFLRLGSIVSCGIAAWFMFKCVSEIKDERAGWYAACLYTASYYAGITAGLFVMPDSPQMIFWTLCLWMLAKVIKDEERMLWWIIFGISAGLCIMSKVHGVFIWSGLGLFVLFKKRVWLKNPGLYTAALLTLAIASPILIWNIQNDFITYRFHSERVVPAGHSGNFFNLLKELIGEFVINNPANVLLIFTAIIAGRNNKIRSGALSIFSFTAWPLIGCILLMAFFRKTLPHWSGPAYIGLLPCAAVYLAQLKKERLFPVMLRLSLIFYAVFLIGCTSFIYRYPGTTGNKDESNLGKGDITLDMYGWQDAGKQFKKIYEQDAATGTMPAGAPVVCNNWWGAHEEYYFCRPLKIQMIGLGSLHELHHYAWLNKERSGKANMSAAYCIIHSDENYDALKAYGEYYSTADTAAVIKTFRGGKPAHTFYVLRLKGWKGKELTLANHSAANN